MARKLRDQDRSGETKTTGVPKPNHYMDGKMLEHYRQELTALRQQALAHLNRAMDETRDHPTSLPDEGDQASKEAETELELHEINRQRKLLTEIDAALERMDQGEYGYCESCGLEIGVKRLDVRPVATLCIDCKSLEETRVNR